MENEIKKLIELAKDYAVFGTEARLEQTHNTIRDENIDEDSVYLKGKKMSIYFNDNYRTKSISFSKDIEVVLYSNSIKLPFDANAKLLNEVYNDAYSYLHDHLFPNVAKCKIEILKEKHKEIKRLEAKLKSLKYGDNYASKQ